MDEVWTNRRVIHSLAALKKLSTKVIHIVDKVILMLWTSGKKERKRFFERMEENFSDNA